MNEYILNLIATAQRGIERANNQSIDREELYKTLRVIASVCNRAADEIQNQKEVA